MTCNRLRLGTVINGTSVVQSYLRNGVNLPVAGVEEFIVIETGAIAANATKFLETSKGDTTFKLESLWVDATNDNNFAIDFDVLWGQSSIFKFVLNTNQIPFAFPPVIVTPELNLTVKPASAVNRILCYARPVAIIENMKFV